MRAAAGCPRRTIGRAPALCSRAIFWTADARVKLLYVTSPVTKLVGPRTIGAYTLQDGYSAWLRMAHEGFDTMNRVMLVTGASRGLGAAIAELAAKRGYAVGVNYSRDEERANGIVSGIRAGGGKAIAIRADVASDAEVTAMFERVDAELGPLGVLVNNAGIAGPNFRVESLRIDDVRRMFETNVYGSFLCSKEAIRRMSFAHGGAGRIHRESLVRIESPRGSGAQRALLCEQGRCQFNDCRHGTRSRGRGHPRQCRESGRHRHRKPGARPRRRIGPTLPMKRAGRPEEVANTVLWLASDEASYVTGAIIDVWAAADTPRGRAFFARGT